jgi:hypothetical protein
MKTGKKILTSLLVGLLILIGLVALLINIFGDRALKIGIENGAEKALKVGVRLDNVSLSIFGGKLNLNNLEVDNPQGYQHPNLLKVASAYMALNTKSLLSDTVEMEKLQFDNISLTIEQKGLTNNLQEILNNLPKSDAPAQPDAKPSKQLKIRELQINGVEVSVKLLPVPGRADTVKLRLPPITLTNLGGDEDIDVAELTAVILKAIAGGVMEEGKGLLPLDMINDLGKGVLGIGQDALKQGTDIGKGIIEGAGDIGKGAGDAIRGIFQKKEE